MKRFILLAMFCPLLQGCVGIVVQKQQTEVINNPVISSHPDDHRPAYTREQALEEMATSQEFKEVIKEIGESHEKGVNGAAIAHAVANATNHVVWVVYTSAWLQTHWGSPYRVCHSPSGADEVWTYRFGPIWEGVMPWLIVPIPLVLPVGEKKVCFTLRDGQVVSVSSTTPALGGFFWPTGM